MERIERLLRLYRLALRAPPEMQVGQVSEWLRERQALIDGLAPPGAGQAAPQDLHGCVERALLAVILHTDRDTGRRMAAGRQRISALMRRGGHGPGRGYG